MVRYHLVNVVSARELNAKAFIKRSLLSVLYNTVIFVCSFFFFNGLALWLYGMIVAGKLQSLSRLQVPFVFLVIR